MSTWHDPHAGDERRAQLLRIQQLPESVRWLRQPAKLYQVYRNATSPKRNIAYDLRISGAYNLDPQKKDHIDQDATLLWTWAVRWKRGYDDYRCTVQRRKR